MAGRRADTGTGQPRGDLDGAAHHTDVLRIAVFHDRSTSGFAEHDSLLGFVALDLSSSAIASGACCGDAEWILNGCLVDRHHIHARAGPQSQAGVSSCSTWVGSNCSVVPPPPTLAQAGLEDIWLPLQKLSHSGHGAMRPLKLSGSTAAAAAQGLLNAPLGAAASGGEVCVSLDMQWGDRDYHLLRHRATSAAEPPGSPPAPAGSTPFG